MNISAKELGLELMEVAEAAYLTTINGEGFLKPGPCLTCAARSSFPV